MKHNSTKTTSLDGGPDTQLANRQIKDGIFKLLFESPENAAELYYALTGIECSIDEIQVITITTTISGRLKNDLAFVVKNRIMVVGEHQSTPNANMPVRFLMYVGQLYEKWIKIKGEEEFLYRSKLYKIPTPEFVVFYNGTAAKPEIETLCLSSSFEDRDNRNLGLLELEVPVYNINKGMNEALFSKSDKLRQYTEFVAKLREFNKHCEDYTSAVKDTVNYCINNDILSDFLKEQGGKIVSILTTEYNEEIARRMYGEELLEDVAIKMLTRGYPINAISEITGLSEDEVLRLKDKYISEQFGGN